MKKYYIIIFTLMIIISLMLGLIIFNLLRYSNNRSNYYNKPQIKYNVIVDNEVVGEYTNFSDATREGNLYDTSHIIDTKTGERIWVNNPQYVVIDENNRSYDFSFFHEAVEFAKQLGNAEVYNIYNKAKIWDNDPIQKSYMIEGVPKILQLPELERGCEVTSLSMLLQYAGFNVSKMELASKIKKDTTPYEVIDGKIHFGNPHIGFVGDIYTKKNPGYGVYHEPLYDLLKLYMPINAIDLTGSLFEDVLYFVSKGYPVVVIINTSYDVLPESQFQTWATEYGDINITYREHSVIITGYDEDYIYFNDPLNYEYKAPREQFKNAWIQMGSQALTYVSTPIK